MSTLTGSLVLRMAKSPKIIHQPCVHLYRHFGGRTDCEKKDDEVCCYERNESRYDVDNSDEVSIPCCCVQERNVSDLQYMNYYDTYRECKSRIENVPNLPPAHPITGEPFRPYFPCGPCKPNRCNPCDFAQDRRDRIRKVYYCKALLTCPKCTWPCKTWHVPKYESVVVHEDPRVRKRPRKSYRRGKLVTVGKK